MTQAAALLAEVYRRGAIAYRIGDHIRLRPAAAIPCDLLARVRRHKTELLPLLPEGTPATASAPAATRELSGALRIASRTLGEDVWLVADDEDAATVEAELAAEGDTHLVFTLAEVQALRGMLAADMRSLARIKRIFPGSRIDVVTPCRPEVH
jgi:hypothetical protein